MKRRGLRLAFQSVTILLLVATALLVLGPVRRNITQRVEDLRAGAISRLEAILGRRVSYEQISPSILNYLNVTGLVVHGTEEEARDLLSIERLRLYYRPLRLIRGEFANAFSQIRIENSSIAVDLRTEEPISEAIVELFMSPAGETTLLPEELVIQGRNLRAELTSESGVVALEQLFFDTTLEQSLLRFDLRGQASLTGVGLPIDRAEGELVTSGSVDLSTGATLAEVALNGVETDLAVLERLVLQVRLEEGELTVRNVQNRDPIDLLFRRSAQSEEMYARVLADGYALGDLLELRGALAVLNPLLQFPVQGQASLTATPSGTTYSGSFSSEVGAFSGLPAGLLTTRVSGNESEFRVDQFDYATGSGRISYAGRIGLDPILPTGTVVVEDVAIADLSPVSARFRFVPTDDGFTLDTEPFVVADTRVEQLTWRVTYEALTRTQLELATDRRSESTLSVGTVHDPDWTLRSASLSTERFDVPGLATVVRAVAPDTFSLLGTIPDGLRINSTATVSTLDGLSGEVSRFLAFDQTNARNSLSLSAIYRDDLLAVRDLDGIYERQTLTGGFEVDGSSDGPTTLSGDFNVSQTRYNFEGTLDEGSVRVSGERGAELLVGWGNDAPLFLSISGDIPLPAGLTSPESRVVFTASGEMRSIESWSLDIPQFDVTGVTFGPVTELALRSRARLSDRGLEILQLDIQDELSRLTGSGSAVWNLSDPSARIDLRIAGTDENGDPADDPSELYSVSGSVMPEQIELSAEVVGLPLRRLGVDAVTGTAELLFLVTGTVDNPRVSADLSLSRARFNNDPVELTLAASVLNGRFSVDSGRARVGRTRIESLGGALDLNSSVGSLRGQLVQLNDRDTLVVNASAETQFMTLERYVDVLSSPFRGDIALDGLPSPQGPASWDFRLQRGEDATRLLGGPEGDSDAIDLTVDSDGSFEGRVAGDLPISFDSIGYLEAGIIEADLIGVTADLERLWTLIEPDGVSFTGGTGVGSLRIVGPLNDPDFYGTLVVSDITGDIEWIEDPAGPARTFVVLEEKVLTVREATVNAGEGAADVSAAVTFDRWGVEEFLVSIATIEGRPLPLDTSFGRVELSGDAAGTLQIRGGRVSLAITGDLSASDMSIAIGANQPGPAGDAGLDVTADLRVRTGRGVEFLWPSETFPILRSFADTDEQIRIVYDGGNRTFGVDGAVAIQGGEIFYFDRSFYITEGAISFAEDETEFDPRLSVNAEIREVSDEGPVTIFLIADERPLSEFTPQWRSDPPLSEAAILTLLGGTVFVGDTGEPINLSDAVLLTSDLVSQFGLIRGFESSVREALNLDLFSIRTQLFQNLLRGVIDQNESIPLDSTVPSLGEYLDNTTLFAGRYLGTDLFLELLVQLRQTESAIVGQQSLTGIEIDSEVSLEWETPFFQLEWGFFPTDPSSLFLADNTIRFSWDYSY